MEVLEIIRSVGKFFNEVFKTDCRVLGVLKNENGWEAICEVVVDENYTRIKGLGGIVEVFNVYLNESYEVVQYKLEARKERASIN